MIYLTKPINTVISPWFSYIYEPVENKKKHPRNPTAEIPPVYHTTELS